MPPSLPAFFHAARSDPALAVLEGFHSVKHAIRFGAELEAVVSCTLDGVRQLATRLAPDICDDLVRLMAEVSSAEFDQLAPRPPESGVIAVARRSPTATSRLLELPTHAPVVLLEAPSHSGNIGAVVRVAAGAAAVAVVCTGRNDPWNPGAIRGSAGLHFALPVLHGEMFDPTGRVLIAIDPEGVELTSGAIPDNAMLAFGSERSGLSTELRQRAVRCLRIPMAPKVSSLNLATAVAVTLYSWRLGR